MAGESNSLKYVIIFGILFAVGIAAVWTITVMRPVQMDLAEEGDRVKINFTGLHENLSLFEKGELNFTIGEPGKNTLGQSIEQAVLGMRIGENKTITLTPEKAFGEYSDDLLMEMAKTVIVNDTITFATTPEQFNATFYTMPEIGFIITSVDLPWKTVEVVDFTDTTMTWKLKPPENHRTSWPLDCQDRNRLTAMANDCYATATMNLIEGDRLEIKLEPFMGEKVSVGGIWALVRDSGNESTYHLDFNHDLAGQSFYYSIKLLSVIKK